MVAIVAQQSPMIWQPNRAVVVVFSTLAAAVVLAIIIFMFDRPLAPAIRVTPIEIRISSATVAKQIPLKLKQVQSEKRNKPQAVQKQRHLVKVENIPLKTIEPLPSPPVDWRQQIQITVKSQGQSNPNPMKFMLSRLPPVTPLQQALNAPRNPESMQNGESYRSIYGGTIQKINGVCVEIQTIQVGTSPSNRSTISMLSPFTCPGNHKPTMAEELSNWADKEAQKHQPP